MKKIVRTVLFVFISMYCTQIVMNSFNFTDETNGGNIPFLLVVIALSLLAFFVRPVFGVVGLPTGGPAHMFLRFVLNLVLLYILAVSINGFKVSETEVSELIILGVVLPSKNLSKSGSFVFSALLFTVMQSFFEWACSGKK